MPTHSFSLRELFDVAVDLPAPERVAVLDALCPDTEQRLRLERMLALEPAADSGVFPRDAADGLARAIGDVDEPAVFGVGNKIGAFELIELLGEGGSSTVFRAARDNDGVRQIVALKLLRRGLYSPDAKRQFRRERLALSQLQHPGIARLIEGGVTENGLAYIALDLVEGQPITQYARAHRLDLPQRLDLFAQVCRAVEAAHRALIVHRDLKPSNVLVTNEGHVKLIDFGVAKLLDTEDETQTRLPAFTPAYAAPEQQSGGPITTATDVYALGILLGELVTGQRLNDGSGRTPSGEIPAGAEPGVLPSTPVTTRRQVRGDLDNIVLKALAAEPERRYASAGAFADDIERHRDGRPVTAHRPTRWYRTSKFIQRHRGGVLVTVLFAAAVFAALGIALWQGNAARHELQRADAMRDFLFSAFGKSEPSTPRPGPPTITEVVDQAIVLIHADSHMDARVRTELLSELGAVLRRQGRADAARDGLLANFEDARRTFGEDAALTLAAGHELTRTLILTGDYPQARERIDRLLQHVPPDADALRAKLLMDSATLATKQTDAARALRDGALGLAAARRVDDVDVLEDSLEQFGNVQLSTNDLPGAIATYQELVSARRQRFGAAHIYVASDEAGLARAYRRNGQLDLAEKHARAAVAIDNAALPPDDWRHAVHMNALEAVLSDRHDYAAARDMATEDLRITRIAYNNEHPDVALGVRNVGMLDLLMEDYAAAVPLLREALDRYVRAFGEENVDAAIVRANYGFALAQSGDVTAGQAELRRALATFDAMQNADPVAHLIALTRDARLRLDLNDVDGALAQIDRIDALLARMAKRDLVWTARTETLRGEAAFARHNSAAAQTALDAAETALTQSKRSDNEVRVQISLFRAQIALERGDRAAARRDADAAFARLAALPSPGRRLTDLAARVRSEL